MTSEEFKIQILPYASKLYPMLKRMLNNEAETQDAVQDLMLKLWAKRNELEQIDNRGGYIVSMARNYCLDLIKKKKPLYLDDENQHKLINLTTEDTCQEDTERLEHVRNAIEMLPEKYRQIIQYRDIDGLEFTEINELTGIEIPTIRVILSRARLSVKNEVKKIYSYGTESITGTDR